MPKVPPASNRTRRPDRRQRYRVGAFGVSRGDDPPYPPVRATRASDARISWGTGPYPGARYASEWVGAQGPWLCLGRNQLLVIVARVTPWLHANQENIGPRVRHF